MLCTGIYTTYTQAPEALATQEMLCTGIYSIHRPQVHWPHKRCFVLVFILYYFQAPGALATQEVLFTLIYITNTQAPGALATQEMLFTLIYITNKQAPGALATQEMLCTGIYTGPKSTGHIRVLCMYWYLYRPLEHWPHKKSSVLVFIPLEPKSP